MQPFSKLDLRSKLVVVSLLAASGPLVACGGQSQRNDLPSTSQPTPPGAAGAVGLGAGGMAPATGSAVGGGSSAVPEVAVEAGSASLLGGAPTSNSGGQAAAGNPIDACSPTTWTATASVLCVPEGESCVGWAAGPQTPSQAIDGDPKTRYTSGRAQDGTEEFVVTFPATVTISGIAVTAPYAFDASGAYAVEFSSDGTTFLPFAPPLEGPGVAGAGGFASGPITLTVTFPATAMKAIKLKQTDNSGQHGWWSITEFTVTSCTAG
jgi:F5/8 type C domain